jgi:ABC-type uncharacterized transport system involved in gliding motility auxiliary subunit
VETVRRRTEWIGYGGLLLVVLGLLVRLVFLDSGAVALGLAVAGLLLFIFYLFRAGMSVDRFLRRRSTREGGSLAGTSLFLLGIAILVNLLAGRFSVRWDTTASRRFSLAPETVAALKAAPVPPEVWVFLPETSPDAAALQDLLQAAQGVDRRLKFRIVDPRREPALAARFDVRGFTSVVKVGERFRTFDGSKEEDFLGALVSAERRAKIRLGYLAGHGEAQLTARDPQGLRESGEALRRRGFDPFKLDLLHGGSLVDSLDAVVVAGPRAPLAPAETESLRAYLDRGGRMAVFLDPSSPVTLDSLLARGGFAFDPRFIQDPDQTDPQVIHPAEISDHPAVAALRDSRISVVFPGVGEILPRPKPPGTRQAFVMRSGRRSRIAGDPNSEPRTRALVGVAEWSAPHGLGRLAVTGDADFVANANFDALGNGDLFLGLMTWLSDPGTKISLRPRERDNRPVILSRQQGRAIMVLVAGIFPLGVLAGGVVVWWRRR